MCPITMLVALLLFSIILKVFLGKPCQNYSIYVVECSFQLSVDAYEIYMHLMLLLIFLQFSYDLNVIGMTQVSRLSS